jgi:hypothetical protein
VSHSPNGKPRKTSRVQPGDQVPPARATPGPPAYARPAPPPAQAAAPQPVPSLEVLTAEFQALVTANQAKFDELGKTGASPDPFYLVHARINSLIDSIAAFAGPNGPRWAVMTRLSFERQIAAELAEMTPAVRRMQLAEGARYTPAMIRALAAQTGTLRRAK